ncbi:ArsR/SmtB family transcription factor [Amycolatopsis nigrescens]|uniref:ArsR/SmtB family transcription factor n=1 Tax=Amycolatopsis nigrescens TaxID=381445 RepID=UPI0003A75558|nr:winged helix-turn-helix domain-containing protein [Amycolatopsis nigrescens]
MPSHDLLEEPERLRHALSPLRRRLLTRLRTPASAPELAAELEMPRQRVGYHLRQLEDAGLVELVEQRQRRGCVERVLRATADAFVVDPAVLDRHTERRSDDRHAAEHLIDVASRTVRDLARMQAAAERQDTRLLTFTLETEVRFGAPADVHTFTEALADAIAGVVAAFDTPEGKPYRLIGAGHPAPRTGASDDRSS